MDFNNNNYNTENNNDKITYAGWEDSKTTNTEKKETLAVPKETYDNSKGIELENEDKPYTVIKGKNRGRVKILNKILLFLTIVFFALIIIYAYNIWPYK